MSMLLDIIVLAVMILVTVYYAKKGFIRSVTGFVCLVVSLVAASILCEWGGALLHPYIRDTVDSIRISDSLVNSLADRVLGSEAVSVAIAFGVIFLVSLLLCKLIMVLISIIFELPVLHSVNHLAGFLLGLLIGFLYAEVLSLVLFCFSEYLIGALDWLSADVYSGSIVAKWMFENTVFKYVLEIAG